MSKIHEELCNGIPDMDIVAIKEWGNEHGEMGVYHETSDGELYEADRYILAILLLDGRLLHDYFSHNSVKMLIEDATLIAEFAGAKVLQAEK